VTRLHVTRDVISRKTLAEFGLERLNALCGAAGASSAEACELFRRMTRPWGERPIGERPAYRSNVADDEAPFEFSIAFSDGAPEVQFYVEALGNPPGLRSNMPAGRALIEALASQLSAPLDRLHAVQDLFFPSQPQGAFTSWTGVSCTRGRPPQLKVYLNPQVRGSQMAASVTADALQRLGLGTPWARVQDALVSAGTRFDEISIVSLDLSDARDARVKVYVRHHGARIADLESFASTASEHSLSDVWTFYTTLGHGEGPFLRKPVITEMAFMGTSSEGPSSVTLEFPIGSYVASDEVARLRIADCMIKLGLSPGPYEAAALAFATRPLGQRAGMHAHVTLRRQANRPRIGVYFASEAYLVGAPSLLEDIHGTD
jgi:DMATS type aromatic prenyltransferase